MLKLAGGRCARLFVAETEKVFYSSDARSLRGDKQN